MWVLSFVGLCPSQQLSWCNSLTWHRTLHIQVACWRSSCSFWWLAFWLTSSGRQSMKAFLLEPWYACLPYTIPHFSKCIIFREGDPYRDLIHIYILIYHDTLKAASKQAWHTLSVTVCQHIDMLCDCTPWTTAPLDPSGPATTKRLCALGPLHPWCHAAPKGTGPLE